VVVLLVRAEERAAVVPTAHRLAAEEPSELVVHPDREVRPDVVHCLARVSRQCSKK